MTVQKFFRNRNLTLIAIALLLSGLYFSTATLIDYHLVSSVKAIPAAIIWMVTNFMPTSRAIAALPEIVTKFAQTVTLSIAATLAAAFLALIVALTGSETTGINRFTKLFARIFASFCRNIPLIAWAMILLLAFKQSDLTGLLALFLGSFGYLTRAFMSLIDTKTTNIYETLSTTGANYLQIVCQGILPSISSSLLSWILYMIENNIRDATLVGILTGTGIGFSFDLYYKSFRFDLAGMTTLVIIVGVVCVELSSNQVRRLMR